MLLVLLPLAVANPDGKVGAGVSGCTCHGNPSDRVEVQLGADATEVGPGELVNLTLVVRADPAAGVGFNVATKGGSFVAGEHSREERGEVTHSAPLPPTDGVGTFHFSWSADTDGTFRLYGAGLAGNGDGEEVGDAWAFANDVTVVVGTGVAPDDSGRDSGDDTGVEPPPCGCSHGGGASLLVGLLPLVALRRRQAVN